MRGRSSLAALALGVMVVSGTMACSGSSPVSPTAGPADSDAGVSTIRGKAMAASRGAASGRTAAEAPMTLRVCIAGTSNCVDVDGSGSFELTGDFSGDVQLEFTTPQGRIVVTVPDVDEGETVVVTVEIDGTTGVIYIESRDDDSADDDSADDESKDDESKDDESEDSEDEDSEDNESDDDESDDESEDDRSDDSSNA